MSAVPIGRVVRKQSERPNRIGPSVLLTPLLFPEAFTRKSGLGATLFSRLHVIAVALDLFDDVFRLDLALEPPESVLQRFAFLNNHFRHAYSPPFLLWFRSSLPE